MKFLGGALAFIMAFALFSSIASAFNFTDSSEADFNAGVFTNATVIAGTGNITLDNDTVAYSGEFYYPAGNYSSKIFDAGFNVSWTSIDWTESLGPETDINISLRAGNTPTPDGSWNQFFSNDNPAAINPGNTRYIQYQALLGANDVSFTPYLESVSIFYSFVEPVVTPEYPPNNHISTSPEMEFNCSVASINELVNITFYSDISGSWKANKTVDLSGHSGQTNFTITGIPDGTFKWNCEAWDVAGQVAFASSNSTATFSSSDQTPVISFHSTTPENTANDTDVSLNISATDDIGIDSVWATITPPDGIKENVTLVNNGAVNYRADQEGNYGVTFYANDTIGQTVSVADSFKVSPYVLFDFGVNDYNLTGINATVTILKDGAVVSTSSDLNGSFSTPLLEDIYDLRYTSFDGQLEVTLEGVDINDGGKSVGLDILSGVDGYIATYVVNNPYVISSGKVKIKYNENDLNNESHISIFVCNDWNFGGRFCNSNIYSQISTFDQDTGENTLEFNVTGFSSFNLDQGGFCGDGICDIPESATSCPSDCQCVAGQTRQCGSTDAGECSFGSQICSDGRWGSCVGSIEPVTEICNQRDDDCDGVVDNVNGGNSIEAASCQCYGESPPFQEEVCNGIDDDCDTVIDGFTKGCGSNVGACTSGLMTCTNGVFGDCVGSIEPRPEDICGNSIDDDCDSEVDENCANCFNGLIDGDEEGVDCGGICPNACGPFDFSGFDEGTTGTVVNVVAVVIVVVAGVAGLILYRKRKSSWSELEKRYSYAP